MSELVWPLSAFGVLFAAYQLGGMPVFLVVGVAGICLFKVLGDVAGRR